MREIEERFGSAMRLISGAIRLSRPRGAYIGGWRGHNNLGDEALYWAMVRIFGEPFLIEYGGGKFEYILSRTLSVFQYAVLAGGTLINAHEETLRAAQESLSLSGELIVFGTGLNDTLGWTPPSRWVHQRNLWESLLSRCSYVGVRGPVSARVLAEAGLNNVEVIGDPVLVFADDDSVVLPSVEGNSLGINFGTSSVHVWGDQERIASEVTALARLARQKGWAVSWFVIWPKDLPVTITAAHASGTADRIYEVYEDHARYKELVRNVTAFVGMKLHAVVLATCCYVPCVMLEYQPKCADFMHSIGEEEHMYRTDTFTAEEVWEMVTTLAERRDVVSTRIKVAVRCLRDAQLRKAMELRTRISARFHD